MANLNLIVKEAIEFLEYADEDPVYRNPSQDLIENLVGIISRWNTQFCRDESQLEVGRVYKTHSEGYIILPLNTPLNLVKLDACLDNGRMGPKIIGRARIEELVHTPFPAEEDGVIYKLSVDNKIGVDTVNTEITFKVLELYVKITEKKHLVETH